MAIDITKAFEIGKDFNLPVNIDFADYSKSKVSLTHKGREALRGIGLSDEEINIRLENLNKERGIK
jgi:hypothetical protein